MGITSEYYMMCELATEIQDGHLFRIGECYTRHGFKNVLCFGHAIDSRNAIFLPDMRWYLDHFDNEVTIHYLDHNTVEVLNVGRNLFIGQYTADSAEKALLEAFMWRMHNKRWHEERWEKL